LRLTSSHSARDPQPTSSWMWLSTSLAGSRLCRDPSHDVAANPRIPRGENDRRLSAVSWAGGPGDWRSGRRCRGIKSRWSTGALPSMLVAPRLPTSWTRQSSHVVTRRIRTTFEDGVIRRIPTDAVSEVSVSCQSHFEPSHDSILSQKRRHPLTTKPHFSHK